MALMAVTASCSTSVDPAARRIQRLRKQAYEALQLDFGILRWQAYWNGRTYPEYAEGKSLEIPVFSNTRGDAIGFCTQFTSGCVLYSDRGRGLESVGSFRYEPGCDESCQSVEFTDLYRRMPKFHPPGLNTNDAPQSESGHFDTTQFAGRDYDVNAPTPPMQVQFSVEWTLPSLGIETLTQDEPPPEPAQLLDWARKDAESIFRPECGNSVTILIPFNVPPRDSMYVYFVRAPLCDDYAVLVHYDSQEGWRRGVDVFNPLDVLPLKSRIEAHLFRRLDVTP